VTAPGTRQRIVVLGAGFGGLELSRVVRGGRVLLVGGRCRDASRGRRPQLRKGGDWCSDCSNPVGIRGDRYRDELETEHWRGCRCQALHLTGDAAATDPVCRFSPHHGTVVAARESAQTDEFTYRTMRRPARV
jgi:hypothetical protein